MTRDENDQTYREQRNALVDIVIALLTDVGDLEYELRDADTKTRLELIDEFLFCYPSWKNAYLSYLGVTPEDMAFSDIVEELMRGDSGGTDAEAS